MKKFSILFFFLILFTLPMFAQDGTAVDPAIVNLILTVGVIGGFGVIAITELLKRLLKTQGALSVALSIVVSIAVTAAYLLMNQMWTIPVWALYSAIVALAANGIYLFPQSRNG